MNRLDFLGGGSGRSVDGSSNAPRGSDSGESHQAGGPGENTHERGLCSLDPHPGRCRSCAQPDLTPIVHVDWVSHGRTSRQRSFSGGGTRSCAQSSRTCPDGIPLEAHLVSAARPFLQGLAGQRRDFLKRLAADLVNGHQLAPMEDEPLRVHGSTDALWASSCPMWPASSSHRMTTARSRSWSFSVIRVGLDRVVDRHRFVNESLAVIRRPGETFGRFENAHACRLLR